MRLPPRLTVLCCSSALVLAGGPGLALAQSAGDEQYQDPFGDEPAQTQVDPGADPGASLTDTPQTDTGQPAAAPSPSAPAPLDDAPQSPAAGGRLADTGIDTRLFLALGAALLLAGSGLRLRTRPERF